MWGPYSKADEKYYKRLEQRKKERRARIEKLKADIPRRMEILKRVKDGNLTLKEAQKIIRHEPCTS